jgi:adenine deaminase
MSASRLKKPWTNCARHEDPDPRRQRGEELRSLASLLRDHPDEMMFCSDDKHPDRLVAGHINDLCARAVAAGNRSCTTCCRLPANPVAHYKLPIGRLRVGDPADLIVVEDLVGFRVRGRTSTVCWWRRTARA